MEGCAIWSAMYNRFMRWSRAGIFNKIFCELSRQHETNCLMINATHLKVHRTAASLLKKGRYPAALAARRAFYTPCAMAPARPERLVLTAGQTSDYTGARTPASFPLNMIADRGLVDRRLEKGKRAVPPRNNRKKKRRYSKQLYIQRHKIHVRPLRMVDLECHTFFFGSSSISYADRYADGLVHRTALGGMEIPSRSRWRSCCCRLLRR